MGKLKKVSIGFGIVIAFFILVIAIGASNERWEREIKEADKVHVLMPEQIKAQASEVSYDDLMRNNEDHLGKIVHYKGKIVQTQNVYGDTYVLRVSTSEPYYFDDIVWVNYAGKRVLEGDIIEFWGKVKGLKEYAALLGNSVTIPEIDASILDVIKKQGE